MKNKAALRWANISGAVLSNEPWLITKTSVRSQVKTNWMSFLTLSLPRIIKFPSSLTRNFASHSMENFAFRSVLTTSLIHFVAQNVLFELGSERVTAPLVTVTEDIICYFCYTIVPEQGPVRPFFFSVVWTLSNKRSLHPNSITHLSRLHSHALSDLVWMAGLSGDYCGKDGFEQDYVSRNCCTVFRFELEWGWQLRR